MLASCYKLADADINDRQRENFLLLRKLLGESGYAIFRPLPEWRRHDELDIIVFRKKVPQVESEPVWVHPGRNGSIVLRAWSGKYQKQHIAAVRSAIPSHLLGQMKLRQGRRPFKRPHESYWDNYFPKEELEVSRLLDLGL